MNWNQEYQLFPLFDFSAHCEVEDEPQIRSLSGTCQTNEIHLFWDTTSFKPPAPGPNIVRLADRPEPSYLVLYLK